MTTLQEYLEKKYPTKEDKEGVRKIDVHEINIWREMKNRLDGGELDLREFVNLEELNVDAIRSGSYAMNIFFAIRGEQNNLKSPLTKLNVSGCGKVRKLTLITQRELISQQEISPK